MSITIGIIANSLFSEYEVRILKGIQKAAKERNVTVNCFVSGYLLPPEENRFNSMQRGIVYKLLNPGIVDGIIGLSGSIMYQGDTEALSSYYHSLNLPVVSIGCELEKFPSIKVDNLKGMYDLMVHLVEVHGYRKIAFIKGPEGVEDADSRFKVYREVLDKYSIPFDERLVAPGDFWKIKAQEAVRLLFDERKVDIEAIVAVNDITAIEVLDMFNSGMVKLSHPVAVTGYDNVISSGNASVSLTTIAQPGFEMGVKAVELLFDCLEGKTVPFLTVLPTAPVIRRSCGCKGGRKSVFDDQDLEADHSFQVESNIRLTNEFEAMNVINMELASVMTQVNLGVILKKYLPVLNIKSCYLLRYSDESCRYLYVDSGFGKQYLPEEDDKSPYAVEKLLPDFIDISLARSFFATIPLYFEETPLGFAIFESETPDYFILEFLGAQLCNVIKRNELIKHFKDYTHTLEKQVDLRTREIREMQEQMVDAAYHEGMAEIAALTVHNFGNIINSISANIHFLSNSIKDSNLERLSKANNLIEEIEQELSGISIGAEKRKFLVAYYRKIEELLSKKQEVLTKGFGELKKLIEMMEHSIVFQRKYTSNQESMGRINLTEILSKILEMGRKNFFSADIIFEKRYAETTPFFISAKTSKLFYILLNIFKNANKALADNNRNPEKRIIIQLDQQDRYIFLRISDNGIGIEKKNLPVVFNYGYSTSEGSHGFGLHICANFMTEMRGQITIDSSGLGQGAVVTLQFLSAEE